MKLSLKALSLALVMSLTCSPLVLAQVQTTCRHCGNWVASTSRDCPNCHKNPKSITGDPFWDLLIYGVVLYENSKNHRTNQSSYQSPSRHNLTLTGTITSKNHYSNINGYIEINGNEISGNYGYKTNYGCTVKGYTYDNGSMRATEIEDKSGRKTGEYRGKVIAKNKISGTFTNKRGKKFKFTWYLH